MIVDTYQASMCISVSPPPSPSSAPRSGCLASAKTSPPSASSAHRAGPSPSLRLSPTPPAPSASGVTRSSYIVGGLVYIYQARRAGFDGGIQLVIDLP